MPAILKEVLWKYQLVKWDSLENMIGKVKKYTTTHDGEMTSPTHVLLLMGVRKMGSVTAFYERQKMGSVTASYAVHSELKQSHCSPSSHFSFHIQSQETGQLSECEASTLSYTLGAGSLPLSGLTSSQPVFPVKGRVAGTSATSIVGRVGLP